MTAATVFVSGLIRVSAAPGFTVQPRFSLPLVTHTAPCPTAIIAGTVTQIIDTTWTVSRSTRTMTPSSRADTHNVVPSSVGTQGHTFSGTTWTTELVVG